MKERLTGAIILVVALVLLVPELLSGPTGSASTAIPPASTEDAQLRSYTIDLAGNASSPSGNAPTAEMQAAAGAQSKRAPQTSGPANAGGDASTSAEPAASQPAQRVEPKPPATQPAERGEARDARAATAVSESTPPSERPARVGPAKPDAPARAPSESPKRVASSESRPASGWAWQVGSFASRENAERLTRELKGKGFAATVSESSGKGKRLWRVRVGPEAERAGAVALGAKLRAAGQPGGAVVPYP